MHAVLQKSHHIAHLEGGLGNLLCANPDDQHLQAVHHQHHHRHDRCHDAVDEETDICQFSVGFIEAIFFERLFIKGANNHHPGEILPGHQVQPIHQFLDDFEFGRGDN